MKINGNDYEFIFCFSVYRKLQNTWGLKNVDEVLKRIHGFTKSMSMDDLYDFMMAGLVRTDLTEKDIIDHIDSYGPRINDFAGEAIVEAMAQVPAEEEKKEQDSKKKT